MGREALVDDSDGDCSPFDFLASFFSDAIRCGAIYLHALLNLLKSLAFIGRFLKKTVNFVLEKIFFAALAGIYIFIITPLRFLGCGFKKQDENMRSRWTRVSRQTRTLKDASHEH